MKKIIEESLKSGKSEAEVIKEFAENAKYSETLKTALQNTAFKETAPESIAEALKGAGDISKTIVQKKEAEIEAQRLKGQLANAQQRLESLGRGTEMPACWANPATGKPEYIFKINLTSTGLIIHDQKLPNRINGQASLPLSMISFDQELNREAFRTQTSPIAQWSIKHQCRFFVLAHDLTRPEEKQVYKTMLRTLEEHFYKLEIK